MENGLHEINQLHLAETPAKFAMVHSYLQLDNAFRTIRMAPDTALVCINDDQPDVESAGTAEGFDKWMKGKWGGQSEWVDWEVDDSDWK